MCWESVPVIVSFYESQSQCENWLLSQCSRKSQFHQITARFIIYCLYSVWMPLADSPPRSHLHRCVTSHRWQVDYIVLGGRRQCLFPQIQSTVHTGKRSERKRLRFRAFWAVSKVMNDPGLTISQTVCYKVWISCKRWEKQPECCISVWGG